jgi:hypothetical protein
MLQLLYGKLTKELLVNRISVYDSTERILTFLEEQGMRPPPHTVKIELPSPVTEDGNGSKMLLPVYRYEVVTKEGWEPETPEQVLRDANVGLSSALNAILEELQEPEDEV